MNELKNVRVIRYVRPYSINGHSNLGGVTFVFDMDYDKRTVEVRYSVCSRTDNFEKQLGISVASAADPDTFNLDDYRARADEFGGFTQYYLQYLPVKINPNKRDRILSRFLEEVPHLF